jgi:hypothetical protein
MHRPRLLTVLFTLAVVIGLAATYAPEGMVRFHGTDNLTNLHTGAVYFQTDSNTFWVGGVTSNPVKVGTAGVASTNDINTAVANRAVTNAWNTLSLVITNSHPGTNAWLRSDDGTNLYWQAAP